MVVLFDFSIIMIISVITWLRIYSQITEIRMSIRYILLFSAVYASVVALSISLSLGRVATSIFPLLLLVFQLCINKDVPLRLKILFSLYSFNVGQLLLWLFIVLLRKLTNYVYVMLDINIHFYMVLIVFLSSILTIIIHRFIVINFKENYIYLGRFLSKKLIIKINFILFVAYLAITIVYMIETDTKDSIISDVAQNFLMFSIPLLVIVYFFIVFKSQLAAKEEINQLQKTQLDNLAVYTEEIEKMYQTLRGFRHDYQNVLLSLQESIDSEDIEQIKQVYHDILASADVRLVRQIEATNVNELANIHDSAVKSVMFWKITQARDRKVAVDVEIKEEILRLSMSSLHFIRIFSILMDNAIEEAKRTVTPKISIALFVNQGDIIFIVSNSTLLTSVNINQLKKPGYTTKGKNRGIGLSNVDEILTQYSNCYLETELENGVFTQRLVMEGIEE